MNRVVTYSLLDSAGGHFRIDSKDGILLLSKALDREHTDKYTLTVSAADSGEPPLSSTATVVVTISGGCTNVAVMPFFEIN